MSEKLLLRKITSVSFSDCVHVFVANIVQIFAFFGGEHVLLKNQEGISSSAMTISESVGLLHTNLRSPYQR